MPVSHDVYAEILSLATVYCDALQVILQTSLGYCRQAWGGRGCGGVLRWFLLCPPPPKLRSDVLCTFRFVVALEDGLLKTGLEHRNSSMWCSHGIFFFLCWTKYDKASHSVCMLCTC